MKKQCPGLGWVRDWGLPTNPQVPTYLRKGLMGWTSGLGLKLSSAGKLSLDRTAWENFEQALCHVHLRWLWVELGREADGDVLGFSYSMAKRSVTSQSLHNPKFTNWGKSEPWWLLLNWGLQYFVVVIWACLYRPQGEDLSVRE